MARIRIIRNVSEPSSRFYSIHTHSKYSYNDALPSVEQIVAKAKELGYPALALTDHGNMSGSVTLYKECRKAGIKPMPGTELYVVHDRSDKRAKRYHLGLVAYTTEGYRNLVAISTRSHEQFFHKPLLDLGDLADLAQQGKTSGLALTTGCYFGLVTQTLVNDGYEAARRMVATLASWFDTYVELQMHGIEQQPLSEVEIATALGKIADELDLPVVLTQDSHYVNPEDREDHEALKRLVAFGPDPDDGVFPGDGYHMADEEWIRSHYDWNPDLFERGIAGLQALLDKYDMYVEEMEEYSYRIPSRYDDPQKVLAERVAQRAMEIGMTDLKHLQVMKEELETVKVARMAGYLLFVAEVCDHMREEQMFYQIRGSAAGSLLCYLLRITDVDPLKWKLRFDRFLTKDRAKPPDIDIDLDSERRGELIAWLNENYSVLQIGTFGTYTMSGAEETLDYEDDAGSLRVRYLSQARKMGKSTEWSEVPKADRDMLYRLSDLELYSHYGKHAAGLIISGSKQELDSMVPRMYVASSQTMVSQYDMGDVEAIGLVKLDVLGVKTLSVIRRTLQMLKRDPAEGLGFIPLNDKNVFRMIAKGDTGGVFQLEGYSAAKGVRRLKPTKIRDVIAAMALFRPGVMASGATDLYIERRHKREPVPKMHPIIMDATKETYGILLYQDQVIEILRALGMKSDDLNVFLQAVKASNKKVAEAEAVMEKYGKVVRQLCADKGMGTADVKWLWEALEAFAEYSFNRAHATVYGITAYRCAWLAIYHPLEFHAALLTMASLSTDKKKKVAKYVTVARSRGVRLLPPNVNVSGNGYSVDPRGRGVVRGLNSIKGIGTAVATEIERHQPFADLDDLCDRVNHRIVTGVLRYKQSGKIENGVLELLASAGALEVIGVDS